MPGRSRPQSVSRDGLVLLGRELAKSQVTSLEITRKSVLYRDLNIHCHILEENYAKLNQASKRKEPLTPGVEWFLDNYHIVEKHIIDIRRHFPKGYDKSLLKISSGTHEGYPRVYSIAREIFTNTDAVLDFSLLNAYLRGYQEVSILRIGEVWAVPIMVRFALLHHLVELTNNMLAVMKERTLVSKLIDEIIGDESTPATDIVLALAPKVVERPDFLISGAPALIRRLRDRGPKAGLTLSWIEERLREQGREPEDVIKEEQYWLAADQISIANTFTSLRGLSYIDWQVWVESTSKLEHALQTDVTYSKSDFSTRDRARKEIERLARKSKFSEVEIAEKAVELSRSAQNVIEKAKTALYYILGKGTKELERSVEFSKPLNRVIYDYLSERPFLSYSLPIFIISFLLLLRLASWVVRLGASPWSITLLLIISVPLVIDISTNFIQWILSKVTSPTLLPKLNFEGGIPEEASTVVVVQTVVTDKGAAERAVEALYVRAIANDEENVIYGLLADYADAQHETLKEDAAIFEHLTSLIAHLNEQHGEEKFFFLLRKRAFNPSENKWMAWERKRGKVEEFNRLIVGDEKTSFIGLTESLKNAVRKCSFVITLDSDSQLPKNSVIKLVGAAAHPLNAPVFDEEKNVVVDGFAILQPRMGTSLTSAFASRFAQMFSGQSGLDPYTQTVSDVYQDFFGEASYIGKGIYHVKAFERALHSRVPENSLLSHDLFESLFARCAFVSDIELYDDFPSKYLVHARRQHRWTRGDWQLLPWIPWTIPNSNWKWGATPISSLGRWKLIDNLRRSLVAPCLLFFLLLGWGILPGSAIKWLWLSLFVIAFPVVTNLAQAFIIPSRNFAFASHVRGVGRDLWKMFKQTVITFILLPHQAFVMVTAISTTLFRRFISHKKLLEWEIAEHAEKKVTGTLQSAVADMLLPLVLTSVGIITVCILDPYSSYVAIPVLLLWLSSPFLVTSLSQPVLTEHKPLSLDDREYLRIVAFDTWKYFRDHLTEKYNFLIPDNLQIVPSPVVAERTSPTNISLSLLSVVSAYDLGFIPLTGCLELLKKVVDSLDSLEKYQGHFINWYATADKRALPPRYVSFVDSGNLIGHFTTLSETMEQFVNAPIITEKHRQHILNLLSKVSGKETELISRAIKTIAETNVSLTELCQTLETVIGAYPELAKDFEAFTKLKEGLATGDESAFSGKRSVLDQGKQAEMSQVCNELHHWFERATRSCDCRFLFDAEKSLFVIGYNVESARKDQSYYDLLASEARLGSFMAVALGQVPQKHWFSLGRAITETQGGKLLISWSGTMFEYLMPLLVMKDFPKTLLTETYKSVVKAQIAYTSEFNVPWGISESAYSGVDIEKTFQYRAFGVPGLGLKRGLDNDLIISPYSSLLALMVMPKESTDNLRWLEKEGLRGEYGFFESVDYTQGRLAENESKFLVKAFFAHHQGMSLVAMNNILNHGIIQERFHAHPLVKSCELLLHEKFPERLPTITPQEQGYAPAEKKAVSDEESVILVINTPHTLTPRTQLVSNGNLTTMVDNSGCGFLVFEREMFITRWREDAIVNKLGTFIFIKDRNSGEVWSVGYQPTTKEPEMYEVVFAPDKIEIKRRDFDIFAHLEITVSPEDDVEIRRLSVANTGKVRRSLQIMSYGEVCLASLRADAAHPSFNKIFISSEYNEDLDTILFSRRPRSIHEHPLHMFHQVAMRRVWAKTYFDTARPSFIGRGRNLTEPESVLGNGKLKESQGVVLDPIFSLSVQVDLEPGESESVSFLTGVAREKETALEMANKYRDVYQVSRAFEMAWSQTSVELKNERISASKAKLYQKLANALMFNVEKVRASSDILARNRLIQSGLWRFGISGDVPICLVRVTEASHTGLVDELLRAHYYLRTKGFQFDLVILNEFPAGYFQNLQEEIDGLVKSSLSAGLIDKKGGIFMRTSQQLTDSEKDLLFTVTRVLLQGGRGALSAQLKVDESPSENLPKISLPKLPIKTEKKSLLNDRGEYATSVGRFIRDGKAYAIDVKGFESSPLPWSNVIAQPNFGFLVTESGGGYTWSQNSRENRITPWSNDQVTDPLGEVIYIRDTDTGHFFSPTPAPMRDNDTTTVVHGFGYTEFIREKEGIKSNLTMTISMEDEVKCYGLELTNTKNEERDIEVFLYVDFVMGIFKDESQRYMHVGYDEVSQALWAVNHYNNEFAGRIGWISSNLPVVSYTGRKREFIGRNRDVSAPLTLGRALIERGIGKSSIRMSQKTGVGIDSCGVIKVNVHLQPKEKKNVTFFLGEAKDLPEVKQMATKYGSAGTYELTLEATKKHFEEISSPVKVKTPDRAFDILMNGWLLYQTISCRIDGRSAFYQSGGAFGFRDQLQDTLSFLPFEPERVKKQILLNASRQFEEGDVQHWWHPPTGRGTRTRFSDDFLWMPYAVLRYISVTGDAGILNETAPFLRGQLLQEHDHEIYTVPFGPGEEGTVLEHCVRAIAHGLKRGVHNLPLIGCGDWNDGMNEIGREGKGESVWLGWFMQPILSGFAEILQARGDSERATSYREEVENLKKALDTHAWDGDWYRRAFFDDGTPLGSKLNDECKIDSLAQSWAVIVGSGNKQKEHTAMQSALEHLVDRENRVVRLLTPAFDKTTLNPGYIKGYLPGIRENGAQYTHAATWLVIASAMSGMKEEAFNLWNMLNPITHTDTEPGLSKYQGEPYVLCGDVYSVAPHIGRAGWSWYTGSSGWLFQAGLHYILGIRIENGMLKIKPCVPKDWNEFSVEVQFLGKTIKVTGQRGAKNESYELAFDKVKSGDEFVVGL